MKNIEQDYHQNDKYQTMLYTFEDEQIEQPLSLEVRERQIFFDLQHHGKIRRVILKRRKSSCEKQVDDTFILNELFIQPKVIWENETLSITFETHIQLSYSKSEVLIDQIILLLDQLPQKERMQMCLIEEVQQMDGEKIKETNDILKSKLKNNQMTNHQKQVKTNNVYEEGKYLGLIQQDKNQFLWDIGCCVIDVQVASKQTKTRSKKIMQSSMLLNSNAIFVSNNLRESLEINHSINASQKNYIVQYSLVFFQTSDFNQKEFNILLSKQINKQTHPRHQNIKIKLDDSQILLCHNHDSITSKKEDKQILIHFQNKDIPQTVIQQSNETDITSPKDQNKDKHILKETNKQMIKIKNDDKLIKELKKLQNTPRFMIMFKQFRSRNQSSKREQIITNYQGVNKNSFAESNQTSNYIRLFLKFIINLNNYIFALENLTQTTQMFNGTMLQTDRQYNQNIYKVPELCDHLNKENIFRHLLKKRQCSELIQNENQIPEKLKKKQN